MDALEISGLAACLEATERVRANGLQHPKARLARRYCRAHQALIHQRGQTAEDIYFQVAPSVAHVLGSVERAAAGEHRETLEERLLGGIEQVVAPGDRSAQCLLPRRSVARTTGEKAE